MDGIQLQFEGTRDDQLCVMLLSAVAVALLAFGLWHVLLKQWRYGLSCILAALAPPIIAAWVYLSYSGFTGAWFWTLLIGLQVTLAVGFFYAAVYSYLGRRRITTLMILRCLAILALLGILFQPVLSVLAGESQNRPYLPILVDRSESMATADEAYLPTRYVQVVQWLNQQRRRFEKHFRPMYYHFARSVELAGSLDELGDLKPSGADAGETNIAAALNGVRGDFDPKDLPGIFLLSDGIHNTRDTVLDAAAKIGVPIYTVSLGTGKRNAAAQKNIRISSISAPLDVVVNNVAKIAVGVEISGLANTEIEVRLLEEDGSEPVATARLRTDKNVETKTATLSWTPRDAGENEKDAGRIRKLRIEIQPNPAETMREDNQAELHVQMTQPRIRVLYVEGSIRPEYKYLRRLLDSDPNVRFISLVRISGSRFWSYGSIEGRRLRQLPTTDEDFKLFDVLILGDLNRTFLQERGTDRLGRIRKFVRDGGGLLMIGGRNNFGPGGYSGTDVEAALPVVTGSLAQAQETTQFVPQLSAVGEAHPIFAGITDFFSGPSGRRAKTPLPPLRGCVTVEKAKIGAEILAVHPTRKNANGPLIVLAVQQFGAGRSAAFTADTTWQWYMSMRGRGAESPYQRFWGQLVRWLANVRTKARSAGSSVMLRTQRSCMQVGEKMKLIARVQNARGQGDETAEVVCRIVPLDGKGKVETLPMSPSLQRGTFEAQFHATTAGRYRVEVSAADSDGAKLGTDELPLYVAPYSPEKANIVPDETLLRMVADRSGGRYADIAALPELLDYVVERLKGAAGPPPKPERYPLFNLAALFLLFVALLTGEWILRRRWQLH